MRERHWAKDGSSWWDAGSNFASLTFRALELASRSLASQRQSRIPAAVSLALQVASHKWRNVLGAGGSLERHVLRPALRSPVRGLLLVLLHVMLKTRFHLVISDLIKLGFSFLFLHQFFERSVLVLKCGQPRIPKLVWILFFAIIFNI